MSTRTERRARRAAAQAVKRAIRDQQRAERGLAGAAGAGLGDVDPYTVVVGGFLAIIAAGWVVKKALGLDEIEPRPLPRGY